NVAFVRRPAGQVRRSDMSELWVMAPDGGSQRRITENGGNMAWLSGGRLLYIDRSNLPIVDLATRKDPTLQGRGPPPMPSFAVSHDGRWLAYTVPDSSVDIAVASIPGGEGRWLVKEEKEDYHPSFSPSDKWMYFQIDHRNMWRVPGPAQGWRTGPP